MPVLIRFTIILVGATRELGRLAILHSLMQKQLRESCFSTLARRTVAQALIRLGWRGTDWPGGLLVPIVIVIATSILMPIVIVVPTAVLVPIVVVSTVVLVPVVVISTAVSVSVIIVVVSALGFTLHWSARRTTFQRVATLLLQRNVVWIVSAVRRINSRIADFSLQLRSVRVCLRMSLGFTCLAQGGTVAHAHK